MSFGKETNKISDIGSLLSGVGTMIIGISTVIALLQTSSVLDRIINIQKKSEEIQIAVSLLQDLIIEKKAKEVLDSNPKVKDGRGSEEAIVEAVKSVSEGIDVNSRVFIPANKVDEVIFKMNKAVSEEERYNILKKSMKYRD